MKTYLALISTALFAALSVAPAVEALHKYPAFLRKSEIKISNSYTPFGNRMAFSRYGDDGSSCIVDPNGVLTWIDSQGTVRQLEGTELATPMFVTNTECLVWNNRFVDYDIYPNRPKAEIKYFRSTTGSTTVTSQLVPTEGVEVSDTSPVTTTTDSLNFVTFERKDNGVEGVTSLTIQRDTCVMRIYRMTYSGAVQLISSLSFLIRGEFGYSTATVAGPVQDAVSFGSDGSILVHVGEVYDITYFDFVDKYYWFDSSGRWISLTLPTYSDPLLMTIVPARINRCIFTSNTRLVYEMGTNDLGIKLQEQRRSPTTGALIQSSVQPVTGVGATETTVESSSYTKAGNKRYFYTVDPAIPTVLRTYRLVDTGVDASFTRTHQLPFSVGSATVVATVNPVDGSALLYGEDGLLNLWLHSGTDLLVADAPGSNVSTILNSEQGTPLYVTDEQAVIWENARAPIGDDGKIPPAVITHNSRDTGTNVLTPTNVPVIGASVLNPIPYTPSFPYWNLTVLEKFAADTAYARVYYLDTVFIADRDGDGLIDTSETGTGVYVSPTDTGTDPRNADTDNDGLDDYEELYLYGTDPNNSDSDGDGIFDSEEVLTYSTDPTLADTDLDGINDFDEIFLLHTDPNVKSFGETPDPTDNVDFTSTSVSGNYEGLVYDPASGFTFKQTLSLTSKGSFTGSLKGLLSDSSLRGQFDSTGLYTGPVTAQGVTSVQMVVAPDSIGRYIISGSYQTTSGGTLYFELRRPQYSKSNRYTGPAKVTLQAGLYKDAFGPQGNAVGTGTISTSGQVSLTFYLPDGGTQSFSGPILDGDTVALFSKRTSGNKPVIVGSLKFEDISGVSDFDGYVRLFGGSSSSSAMFPTGYDQKRELLGAYYYPPARGTMPLNQFLPTSNNSVFKWINGNFAGVNKVGTWSTNASVLIPKTQFDSGALSFNAATGLMSVSYTRTDTDLDLLKATSKGHVVVQQKTATVNGYYVSARSAGLFEVLPNSGGLPPETTAISPKTKTMPLAGGIYSVTVTTVGAWAVVVPTTATWVSVATNSQTGIGVLTGTGNGTVTITVQPGVAVMRNVAEIKIAGINHTLTRDFR
ncbi:MAG: hypothetical protein WCS43_05665 [Verrucomicrobiota bacterium]